MSEVTYGVDDLVTQIREDLDEPVNTASNLWTDDYLIVRLNRGFREVWEAAREEKQNWFLRKLKSTDDPLKIYGRTFDPSTMRLTGDIDEFKLPPDFHEARSLNPVLTSEGTDPGVVFTWANLSDQGFRDARRTTSTTSNGEFLIDVEFRADGAWLVLSPELALEADTDIELTYVYAPMEFQAHMSLENSGFSRVMLDAAVAYAVLEARRSEGVPTNIREAEQVWKSRIALVTRHAGPRQSEQPERVQGVYEDWI